MGGFIKNEWERAEDLSLRHDVSEHILQHFKDQQKLQDKQSEWLDEERNCVDEAVKALEHPIHEDLRQIHGQMALLELLRRRLLEELPDLYQFIHCKVVKYARVFQLAFYLQRIDRDEIVEPKTNMINWKKSKKFLNASFKTFIAVFTPERTYALCGACLCKDLEAGKRPPGDPL